MKSPTEILLIEVNRFLKRTGMAPTTLGGLAIGDPNLVRDLGEGRELRHSTLMKVRAFMDTYERETA